jgi:spectinomycin phosphotransferase/16S rRNA (guanine(1405)-N(7))-methyltransferase
VFTRPPELSDDAIRASLAEQWGFDATVLAYEPVGFGAHHWRATAPTGDARFVTVHDLTAKRRDPAETEDEVFRRLTASFASAAALAGAGLTGVLAPTLGARGQVVERVDRRFSLAVHPYLLGRPAGPDGEFESMADRLAVLDIVIQVHRTGAAAIASADTDDLAVPHVGEIPAAIDELGRPWDGGPYGERARGLLDQHAVPLHRLLVAYDRLADQVRELDHRVVLTHGEPHASNVLVVGDHRYLIDWDTALLAVAERDLWVLDPGDGSVLGAYRRATGLAPAKPALDLYRLWFDLTEIGQYLGELRRPHTDTADIAESWKNLVHFLQPAERWPELMA